MNVLVQLAVYAKAFPNLLLILSIVRMKESNILTVATIFRQYVKTACWIGQQ